MKFFMALGVVVWVFIAVWLVRLGMGLDHLSKAQIGPGIGGGIGGGVGAWFYVRSLARKGAFQRKGE